MNVSRGFLICLALLAPNMAQAFCGFYVAKADTGLFNESSKVVYVRDGNRNVVTMASDYRGEAKDFAMVVPVPTVLEREQINIANPATIKHLDDYSAPRLVEYFDDNPCAPKIMMRAMSATVMEDELESAPQARAKALGVTVEAEYSVGEYDIQLLSAKESGGLVTWLVEQGYKLPQGAEPVVGSYLKQGMKFFVAKVNLKNYAKGGFTQLRPIQIAYEHDRFMLPIRLGTVNAQGQQELFVFALTRQGRVETTNYRTVKLPSNMELPTYLKEGKAFAEFYQKMFRYQTQKARNQAVFLEYAWDMSWCDPCAADPLSDDELRSLGVFWVPKGGNKKPLNTGQNLRIAPSAARDVFITRLHVRYDSKHFPEDLMFQTTGDRENFQGRYVIRHAWTGSDSCEAASTYREKTLPNRRNLEAKRLANLTGEDINSIREKMKMSPVPKDQQGEKWWKKLWEQ